MVVFIQNKPQKEIPTNFLDEKRKKSNKNALMVFLFALSLQPVSVMIPNIVNQNQLTN